jgi:hypothetical protein
LDIFHKRSNRDKFKPAQKIINRQKQKKEEAPPYLKLEKAGSKEPIFPLVTSLVSMMVIRTFQLSYLHKKTREPIHLISYECRSHLMSAVASDAKSGSRLPAISHDVKAIIINRHH